jgi:hypothetical protein
MVILGGWVAMRAVAWEAEGSAVKVPERPGLVLPAKADAAPAMAEPVQARAPEPEQVFEPSLAAAISRSARPRPSPTLLVPLAPATRFVPMPTSAPPPILAPAPLPVHVAAAHQMLWMAALANLPLPPEFVARPAAPASLRAPTYRDPRWSADGWVLLRRGGAVPAGGLAPATYGASQLGAVVRYRLAPQSAHRPALYLRGSAALNGSREREAAFGVSVRPIAGLPVAVAAEARVNGQPGGTHVRPAAFAYTELPPAALPLGARAEIYGQAGYVGGNFASAFADGQLRVDRRVAQLGRGELRAGGGAWGGAQKGASRLDVGPTATLGMSLGGSAGARLGVDWRFRVAGNAAPTSGPALTLSAGF